MSHNHRAGFTLVELMLSMTFISVMLVAIALCVIQMSTIYNRGETMRQVNQASRLMATNLQQTIGAADPALLDLSKVESHGRLCTGRFTYVWNSLRPDGTEKFTNNRYTGSNAEPIRFVRITDPGGSYCELSGGNAHIDRTAAQPQELLTEGDRSLRAHRFTVTPAMEATITRQQIYVFKVLLGTENIQEIDTTSDSCLPPSDLASNQAYCSVNEFNLTVRAGVG